YKIRNTRKGGFSFLHRSYSCPIDSDQDLFGSCSEQSFFPHFLSSTVNQLRHLKRLSLCLGDHRWHVNVHFIFPFDTFNFACLQAPMQSYMFLKIHKVKVKMNFHFLKLICRYHCHEKVPGTECVNTKNMHQEDISHHSVLQLQSLSPSSVASAVLCHTLLLLSQMELFFIFKKIFLPLTAIGRELSEISDFEQTNNNNTRLKYKHAYIQMQHFDDVIKMYNWRLSPKKRNRFQLVVIFTEGPIIQAWYYRYEDPRQPSENN
ncbi:hypothetical protein L9F63_014560, partial [Diploptera punctata]